MSKTSIFSLVASSWSIFVCSSFTHNSGLAISVVRQRHSTATTTINPLWTWASPSHHSAQPSHQEFSLHDEEGEDYAYDDDSDDVNRVLHQERNLQGELVMPNQDDLSQRQSINAVERDFDATDQQRRSDKSSLEYGCLRPGTVVQIEVGSLQLARKAWKKRRRSSSPLLVPCSILNVDRLSLVRWNLLFLLEKFGRTMPGSNGVGIQISLASLARSYKTYLKSSLQLQVDALGFESSQEMVKTLFNKKVQESYGVVLDERDDEKLGSSMLYLAAPISRRKAQSRAANAPMIQFRPPKVGDYGDSDTLTHTGWIRALKQQTDEEHRDFEYLPLSAALRVAQQEDLYSGRIVEGKVLSAAVFDYDKIGDGGSPLMTMTLDPGTVREKLRIKPDRRINISHDPKILLNDMTVGDGPYKAKVVRVLKGEALVDFGVGRQVPGIGDMVKVLGTLRFKDSVEMAQNTEQVGQKTRNRHQPLLKLENEKDTGTEGVSPVSLDDLHLIDDANDDEDLEDGRHEDEGEDVADDLLSPRKGSYLGDDEVVDDISHLFEVDQKGNLMYKDPQSGELTLLEEGDEIDESVDNNHTVKRGTCDDTENLITDQTVSLNFENTSEDISDEDIARLFSQNDDGSITYCDPETGETMVVDKDDEEFQDMMTMKSLIDNYISGEPGPKKAVTEGQLPEHSTPSPLSRGMFEEWSTLRRKHIDVGEYIHVYVLDVSTQSNQLRVTTNPLIKGQKPKDIKKASDANKKLARLKKQVGGLNKLLNLKGTEVDGVVKATSKTGDWVYIQPSYERELPVGIATFEGERQGKLTAGDFVRCRFAGVDFERGQLSLEVLRKLEEKAGTQLIENTAN